MKTERERCSKEENENSGFDEITDEDIILGGQGAKDNNVLIENIQDSLNQNEDDSKLKEIIQLYSAANGKVNEFIHLLLDRYEMNRDDLFGI